MILTSMQFIITKMLSKDPSEYPDAKGQPHVQAALKMRKMNKPVRVGDVIPYVICEGTYMALFFFKIDLNNR
jgi:DNA polymerase elongation subunit (family B)